VCVLQIITWLIVPLYKALFFLLWNTYKILPKNVIKMVFGGCLCFFGGTYWAVLSAVEAARTMGGQRLLDDAEVVYEQMQHATAAIEADSKIDANHDGVADVNAMSPSQRVNHTMVVAMRAVEQPELLQRALGNLWSAYMSVLATLRFELARTMAAVLAFVEMIEFPVCRMLSPMLVHALGKERKQWAQPLISSALYVGACVVALYIQAIVAAFYSAIRGGKMFADGLIMFLAGRGWVDKIPGLNRCVSTPFDPDESYVDEVLGFGLAAVGFWWQLSHGFELQFPLNLVFWPLSLLQTFLEWNAALTMTPLPLGPS
jgi:hypothetical protein